MPKDMETGHTPSENYLYPRDVTPDHLKRLWERGSHAFEVWFREAKFIRRDPREILHAWTEDKQKESLLKHAIEGWEFVGAMDIADRASNGLRVALKKDNHDRTHVSEFGTLLHRAYNNPELSDHNHEHSRRFERWLEAMMLNIGKLRHSDSVIDWIDSALLSAYFHDIDQLLSYERNLEEQRGKEGMQPELKVKKGHALAAAVMLLALHKRYGEEAVLRTRDAWEISAGAVYMVLKHDIPEELSDALRGRGLPYTMDDKGVKQFYSGTELREKFENNELDLTKITPSQLIDLLKMIKKESGFMNDHSKYGLHPLFEKEYMDELESLTKNDRPLLAAITDDMRKSLDYTTEVAVRADLMEMIAPPVEGIFRKLNTQHSRNRPFFRPGIFETEFQRMLEGPGNTDNNLDSDVRRMLWEFLHINTMSDESGIANSRYIRRAYRENAIMGLLAFRIIGKNIMRQNTSDVETHYKERTFEVARKALKKAGIPVFKRSLILSNAKKYGADVIEKALEERGAQSLKDRYEKKIGFLNKEMESIIMGLMKGTDALPVYSGDEILQFENLCEAALQKLCEQHGVSNRVVKKYKRNVMNGNHKSTTPYGWYDSISGEEDIRTLIKPLE